MATEDVASQEEQNTQNSLGITPDVMAALVGGLSGANRRQRQEASHTIALAAAEDVNMVLPYVDELIDALYRPEAQTRWEALDALSEVVRVDPAAVEGAYDGAEASLFDEDSAIVRLAAFRFLVRLGASDPERSNQVWSLLDEAIQCYHGDPEYRDMLVALSDFVKGSISDETREALLARVGFDAENGYGYVRAISSEIISAAKGE